MSTCTFIVIQSQLLLLFLELDGSFKNSPVSEFVTLKRGILNVAFVVCCEET